MRKYENHQTKEQGQENLKNNAKITWQSRFLVWKFHKSQELKEILSNNQGLGIVEIALIIVVIVALAFLFKERVGAMLNSILDGVNSSNLGEKIPSTH